ncbi:cache domain-containing protein [Pelagibaculum spongiae]|uniref:Oxygen sensor histidine kinase NreB n=1 Tax=Pelagibaculum spongiae TaxID=2080658 RepID=A0A2V1H407_9GAMM|nr:cache domain-containing protein [Pelagibaculum spongiae]PVZ71515.1 histidine kinase [Pelagibaculum spongiae]
MSLKSKILLLTLLPMLLFSLSITLFSRDQSNQLSQIEIQTIEESLLRSRERELRHYTEIARALLLPLAKDSTPDSLSQQRAIYLLNSLSYGDDGYFFAYAESDSKKLLTAPVNSDNNQQIDQINPKAADIISRLMQLAKTGGGYHRYLWEKPSSLEIEDKLSYVELFEPWGWTFGTGLYLDDVSRELTKIRSVVKKNIRNTFFTMLAMSLAAMMVVFLLGLAVNLHEHHLADKKLQRLAYKSIQFQITERRRFARELHDGINQTMVSIRYQLEKIQSEANQKQKNEIEKPLERLTSVIRDVRKISHDLRPIVLDDLGLAPAVKNLVEEFSERTGAHTELSIELAGKKLYEELEITIYRVVQEALGNISNHADASHVKMSLIIQDDMATLKLRDNGCGFTLEKKQNGIGLRNMKERVELLGGQFSLQSSPNAGTLIIATLPLSLKDNIS